MEVRNAKHNGRGGIDIEINHPKFGWIPFTASPDDSETHGRDLHALATAGEFGEVAPYIKPEKSADALEAEARARRDALLSASDWSQLPDVAESTRLQWQPYRQALRDITQQPGFPSAIDWPAPPA